MENLLIESREQFCDPEICKKLAKMFTRSKGRAGKRIAKWTEVQAWFQNRLVCCPSKDHSAEANQKLPDYTEGCTSNKANESSHIPKGQKDTVLSDLEFEARSSKDGAWYDVDTIISHRFLNPEEPVEKMEKFLIESREQVCNPEICKKLAKMFTRSKGRAGKPIAKWTEVQAWFQNRLVCCPSKDHSAEANQKLPDYTEGCTLNKANESSHIPKGQKDPALSDLEFEARSSNDGAWYDIDTFISHRFLNSEEPEALVRFVGFELGEEEWVNVRKAVRERSVALEDSECNKVKVGDIILCFQEGNNQAKYFEAHVIEIQKRLHDIRGCRCLFMIRYTHDDTKETVCLRRLCVRPSILGRP